MDESFEWDEQKNAYNKDVHGITFEEAQEAFSDPRRIVLKDVDHSTSEETRYFCIGKIDNQICAVRFTYREERIRIYGAGYWRKERKIYETENKK